MDQAPRTGTTREPLTPAEIRTVLVGILTAMLLAALDQTIIATALPTIGRDLGDIAHLPWVVTVYLLTATAVTPLYGKFADSHGRRVTMLIGISIFIVGSAACALAPSMLALILARGLQGLGGGGLISLGQTIVGDLVPPRERSKYQVYFASVFMTASLVGPMLGGFFAQHLHWSVIFWINLPLGLVALVISNRALKKLPRFDRRHELDLLGAMLLVAATISLLLALSWGGTAYPWRSAPILGLAALSLSLWALFAWRMRAAREPLIPAGVLDNPVVRMGTLAACFGVGTYLGLTIYLPVYFETVRQLSASASGLALIPLMCGTVAGATICGRSLMRFTHYVRLPLAGLGLSACACVLLAVAADDLSLAAFEAVTALLGLGLGTLLPVSTVAIQNAVAPHQLGTATGTANFFRSLGGAFVVAIYGAIVLGASGLGRAAGGAESLAAAAAAAGIDLGAVFRWVFAAAGLGVALSVLFLWRMEVRPLRSSTDEASGETGPADPAGTRTTPP